MTIGKDTPLSELRGHFLQTSTQSMPLAGMIFWALVGIAARFVSATILGYAVLIGTGMIFPFAVVLDKLRGKARIKAENRVNPVVGLFMQSITLIGLLVPFVIIASGLTHDVNLIVLGLAILAGIVWIPYGWGADDPVGLRHAVGRSIGCYAAYLLCPAPWTASAICAVVVLAYLYSLAFMRKPA